MGGMGMGGGSSSGDSAAGTPENGLSQAEQEGIQKLEGALSKEALDGQLRAVSQYGLGDYTLSSASYQLIEAAEAREEQVLCTLRYLLPGADGTASRTFTVDAKTGQVEDLWSYLPWDEDQKPSLTQAEAQEKASAFLQSFCPDRSPKLALYQGPQGEVQSTYSFTFARQENGCFFPDHSYRVGIDATDGSVSRLSFFYEEDVTFESTEGVIDAEAALDAWLATYDVTLCYLYVPESLTAGDPEEDKLLQLGFQSFYRLKLGYVLEREGSYLGIDAKTGEPVERQYEEAEGLSYTDLEGHWAQAEVETLAQYGVGYDADAFGPGQALTQWDLVSLLYSLDYYAVDPGSQDQDLRDEVYSAAYRTGCLTKEERDDGALLTRAGVIRMLLDRAGYGQVAGLEGIFTCGYPDRADIPAEELGYAALAQGLGLLDPGSPYAGTRTATRAEAAVLLYRLMER